MCQHIQSLQLHDGELVLDPKSILCVPTLLFFTFIFNLLCHTFFPWYQLLHDTGHHETLVTTYVDANTKKIILVYY